MEFDYVEVKFEVRTENEVDSVDVLYLNEKYIKKEDLEICNEKFNVVDHNLKENLINEECNLDDVKIENESNCNQLIKITTTGKYNMLSMKKERMRKYREKLKANSKKYAEYLTKERERDKKRRENTKQKMIEDPTLLNISRKKGRDRVRAYRERQKLASSQLYNNCASTIGN